MFLSYYQTLIIPHSEIYKLSKFKGIRDLCNLLIKKNNATQKECAS